MVKPSFSHSIDNGVRTVLCHGSQNSKGASFPKFVWGWRKILKLRDMVKPSFSHSIGNGVRTVLCHGNWNSKGASFPKFVFRLVFGI